MIRLGILVLLFSVSLLTLIKAPAYPLWLLAILVTEYCWVFIISTIIVLIAGFWTKSHTLVGTITGIVTILLLCVPIIRGYSIAANLGSDFAKAFDSKPFNQGTMPFSVAGLFSKTPNVAFRSLDYVTYRNAGAHKEEVTLKLDFYKAQAQGNRPCVIVVHGGSWSSGNSRQLPELNSKLALAGYHVASINYRLAPVYQSPAQVEDVENAITYLKKHAVQLSIDTNQFVLLGRSAGGQIALLAAYKHPDYSVKGVIDFYGPADMVWGYAKPANPLIFNSRLIMERYLGGSYKQVANNYKESSPIEYVTPHTVPTLIIHGQNDVLVAYEHSTKLINKLSDNKVKHYFLSLPWATHGFDYNINGPGGQLSTYTVMQFMQAVTH